MPSEVGRKIKNNPNLTLVKKTGTSFPTEKRIGFYRQMVRIRKFEETTHELYKQGKLLGMSPHLCIGQEAAEVGVLSHLRRDDYIISTHRGHGHCLAKGADMGRMYAELFGKETGYCHGRGGSMHIADVTKGNLGANGIVGGGLPIALGAGLTVVHKKTDQVVACFFGDAASNQGTFHESLNMSKAFNLPILWVCENNQYGLSTRFEKVSATPCAADRAKGYGMPGVSVKDGMDVEAVAAAAQELVEQIRAGGGPALLEVMTYRYFGHGASDNRSYRTREEEQKWWKRCPVAAYRARLLEDGITEEELALIEQEAEKEVADGLAFAQSSPDPKPEELLLNVYVEE